MASHPVSFDVPRPARYDRVHVAIRLLVLAALSALGGVLGWSWWLLYLLLPAVAAAQAASKGGERYLAEDGPRVEAVLRWVLAAYAYLTLVTDGVPDRDYASRLRFEVRATGAPTPGSALLRLVTSLPAMLFLLVAGLVSAVVWVVAMVSVAVTGDYPASLHRLQVSVLRFQARLLAYHASLVAEPPPFTLEDEAPRGTDLDLRKPA